MKATLLGRRRQSGKARETGNPYDMPMLLIQVPIESVNNDNLQIDGDGYETATMPYDPEKEAIFKRLTYPVTVELETETSSRYGSIQALVVGAKALPAAA